MRATHCHCQGVQGSAPLSKAEQEHGSPVLEGGGGFHIGRIGVFKMQILDVFCNANKADKICMTQP